MYYSQFWYLNISEKRCEQSQLAAWGAHLPYHPGNPACKRSVESISEKRCTVNVDMFQVEIYVFASTITPQNCRPWNAHNVLFTWYFGYPVASAQQSCLQPVIASPQSSSKDGRATDSCFALIGAHQCGVLMADVGWLAASVSTPS